MQFKVERVTHGPKNHFFGFHDLVQSNAKGDLLLSLEVDDISRPPLPGEKFRSGVIEGGEFVPVHDTRTLNYPQGARQQWIGDSDLFLCNDRDDSGALVCRISDARSRQVVGVLPFPVHCLNAQLGKAVYFNYDRVHALCGYGYTPLTDVGASRLMDIPDDDGLFVGDINDRKKGRLLVSLLDVARCGEKKPVRTGFPHYVTHPMLSPDGTRVAFLHRYRLLDGGEATRLMTIGIDGSALRCLAKGFWSHFTWIGNDELFIWGRDESSLYAMREASWLRVPGARFGLKAIKRVVKGLRGTGRTASGTAPVQARFFHSIKDCDSPVLTKLAGGILVEDGHPMANPMNLRFLINDTYPNDVGDRRLMFYDVDKNERYDVGRFRRIFKTPDMKSFDWHAVQSGLDRRVLKIFSPEQYMFNKSGYHCDLHPRWSHDGKIAYFDSIHEGSRQVYSVEIV